MREAVPPGGPVEWNARGFSVLSQMAAVQNLPEEFPADLLLHNPSGTPGGAEAVLFIETPRPAVLLQHPEKRVPKPPVRQRLHRRLQQRSSVSPAHMLRQQVEGHHLPVVRVIPPAGGTGAGGPDQPSPLLQHQVPPSPPGPGSPSTARRECRPGKPGGRCPDRRISNSPHKSG